MLKYVSGPLVDSHVVYAVHHIHIHFLHVMSLGLSKVLYKSKLLVLLLLLEAEQ